MGFLMRTSYFPELLKRVDKVLDDRVDDFSEELAVDQPEHCHNREADAERDQVVGQRTAGKKLEQATAALVHAEAAPQREADGQDLLLGGHGVFVEFAAQAPPLNAHTRW